MTRPSSSWLAWEVPLAPRSGLTLVAAVCLRLGDREIRQWTLSAPTAQAPSQASESRLYYAGIEPNFSMATKGTVIHRDEMGVGS